MRGRTSSIWAGLFLVAIVIGWGQSAEAAVRNWTGAFDSDWTNALNWDIPPTPADDAIIDTTTLGYLNDPTIATPEQITNISLLNGAILNINGGSLEVFQNLVLAFGTTVTLQVGVDLLKVGGLCGWDDGSTQGVLSFFPGSTLELNGGAPQVLPTATYENLVLNNLSGGGVSLPGLAGTLTATNITVMGVFNTSGDNVTDNGNMDVQAPSGALQVDGGTILSILGNCTWGGANGTYSDGPGLSILMLAAGGAQSLPGGVYDRVEIGNGNTVTMLGDVTASYLYLSDSSTFDTGTFAMNLGLGMIEVDNSDGAATLILTVPGGSPAPPLDLPAMIATGLLLDDGFSSAATLTLQGDGRLNLGDLSLGQYAVLVLSDGNPADPEDACVDVANNIFIDTANGAALNSAGDGKIVMGGTNPGIVSNSDGTLVVFDNLQLGKTAPVSVTFSSDVEITKTFGVNGLTSVVQDPGKVFQAGGLGSAVSLDDGTGNSIQFSVFNVVDDTTLNGTGTSSWLVQDSLSVSVGITLDLGVSNVFALTGAVTSASVQGVILVGNGSTLNHSSATATLDIDGDTLDVTNGGLVQLGAGPGLRVINGGTLSFSGTSFLTALGAATLDIDGGTFLVSAGSTVSLSASTPGDLGFMIGNTSASTLDVNPAGMLVDGINGSGFRIYKNTTLTNFNNVSFVNCQPFCRFLFVEQTVNVPTTYTFTGLSFDNSFGGGNNVEATNFLGSALMTIDLTTATGSGIGDAFEIENVNTLINWPPLGSAPFIYEVNPFFSNTGGGESLQIKGGNFASGATVDIGGSSAGSVNVVSAAEITCTAPAGSSGATSLIVTNPDTQMGSSIFFYSTPSSYMGLIDAGSAATQYRMVSIPGFMKVWDMRVALESVLGSYDPTVWRAFHYEPDEGGYSELDTVDPVDDNGAVTGHSIWILSRNAASVSFNTYTTAAASDIEVRYLAGWNQIANPYNQPIAWGSVQVLQLSGSDNSAIGSPIAAPSASSLVDPTLYSWNGSAYVASSSLEPGEGYWIENLSGGPILLIYFRPGGATKPVVSEFRPLSDPSNLPPLPPGVASSVTGGGSSGAGTSTFFAGASGSGSSGGAASSGGGGGGGGCWIASLSGRGSWLAPVGALLLLAGLWPRRRA